MFTLQRIAKRLCKDEPTTIALKFRGLATALRQRRTDLSAEEELQVVRKNWELRCELATAYRAFERYGMSEGICNHLTSKAPSLFKHEGVALVIPYGTYWSEITPENLIGIDMGSGELIEGSSKPDTTAFSIHLGIYRHRPDVNSIMHTHPKFATTLAVLKDPTVQMISQNATRFYNNVAYDDGYEGLADQTVNNEGDRLGKAIGDKQVLLMENHGLVTADTTIGRAFDLHYYFERMAEVQIMAYQTGKPLSYMQEHVVKEMQPVWDAWQNGEVDKHLKSLQDMFSKRDSSFIDPTKAEYMEYV